MVDLRGTTAYHERRLTAGLRRLKRPAMRNVVYCAPFPGIAATHRFAKALRSLHSARLLGLFQEAPRGEVAAIYDDVVVVRGALAARQLREGVEALRRRHGEPHRIVGILENLQVQLA